MVKLATVMTLCRDLDTDASSASGAARDGLRSAWYTSEFTALMSCLTDADGISPRDFASGRSSWRILSNLKRHIDEYSRRRQLSPSSESGLMRYYIVGEEVEMPFHCGSR